ncbi:MAG: arylsulfatase [Gammaproteobacteria bacterium]|nr:arylsulfatase [Gammaproteobacteria bacterium]
MKKRIILSLLLVVAVATSSYFLKRSTLPFALEPANNPDKPLDISERSNTDNALPFEVESPPNIVIIMADDLGWNDVGYHGSEIQTPNLDQLAEGGVELNRFYAHPSCSPTRSSLMTGKSPVRLGVFAPLSKNNPRGLPIEETTLAEHLKVRGYQTALVGKWHLGGRSAEYTPNARGFDYFYGNLMGGVGYWDHVHGGGYDLQRNGRVVRDNGYITHLTAKEAVDVIETREQGRPLFLFASFNAPHLPNEAPAEAVKKYESIENENRRIHAAMVSEFDGAVGQIVSALERQNMLENTLIWFMSDNGGLIPKSAVVNLLPDWTMEMITEKIVGENVDMTPRFLEFSRIQLTQGASDNSPLQGGKTSLWEGGMRVPSILYWKGVLQPSSSEQMIAVQDVLPTLLSLSGEGPVSDETDGRSVWSALTGGALSPNPVVTVSGPGGPDFSVILYPWKLVKASDGDVSLYNVEADPTENHELSQNYPIITQQLEEYLDNFPRGENVAVPYQDIVNDSDFFGGEEDRAPWSEIASD